MLYHAVLLCAAIDRRTLDRGRIGLIERTGILLTPQELDVLQFTNGPSVAKGGYAGIYREFVYR